MTKLNLLGILLLMLGFGFACQPKNQDKNTTENPEKQEQSPKTTKVNDPRSPNPSSELAVLMRDMWEYGDTIRQAILDKQPIPDYRPQFKAVHTATPTDAHTKSEVFDNMATVMLKQLDNFYQETEQDRQIEGFNLLVQRCLQCHAQQCPGPISKISKLTIAEAK